MGECPCPLFCVWHVDRSLRENCRRLVKNSEKMISTYKSVRTLMDEQDVLTFNELMPKLLHQLHCDSSTEKFANLCSRNVANCSEKWAYCHRAQCGINTNMHLERMHGIFKHIYLREKKNKRLDSAIGALSSLVHDKEFDRITCICKGKYTNKLAQIRTNHQKSLTLSSCVSLIL